MRTFVRQGKLERGTRELELALAHDPNRAALRTWLGRAYFEEGSIKKADDQFRLAKKDDPNDSRPYLFAALTDLAGNQPISALNNVIEAEARGAGRSKAMYTNSGNRNGTQR